MEIMAFNYTFPVTIWYFQLTEHVDDIITLIYQYIHMLRKEGAKQWIFKECQVRRFY